MTWLPWRHVQTSNFVRVGTHQSNDSYYKRKHTTPCRGLDFLAAFHKSCPRLPLTLPVIAMFGIEVVGTVIFVYFPRRAEMPTFGNLKSGSSLFCTTPPPPPTSDVNALPRPQIVRVPTGLCIKTRLSSQPLIWKWFFIFIQIKLIFTRKAVHLASSFLTGERLRILYEVLHEVHIIKSRFVKMTK